jgi:hypothetical protein
MGLEDDRSDYHDWLKPRKVELSFEDRHMASDLFNMIYEDQDLIELLCFEVIHLRNSVPRSIDNLKGESE